MTPKSMFSPGGSGMTTGGLDDFLGPEAKDHSNLPDPITEAVAETPVDCVGTDRNEPVCQIAKAEAEVENGERH